MQSCKKRVKQRAWKYWGLGLIVSACFTGTTFATTVTDTPAADSGDTNALGLVCFGSSVSCIASSTINPLGVTSDFSSNPLSSVPILAVFPDNDPSGASNPARFYSYAKSSPSPSVAPAVTCSSATVTTNMYSTSVELNLGGSCAITVTPQANRPLCWRKIYWHFNSHWQYLSAHEWYCVRQSVFRLQLWHTYQRPD